MVVMVGIVSHIEAIDPLISNVDKIHQQRHAWNTVSVDDQMHVSSSVIAVLETK
jgi:hypothetical protein